MNIKELLMIVVVAYGLTWGVERFFFPNKYVTQESGIQSGQSFTAPASKDECTPLKKEVDFIDNEPVRETVKTVIETDTTRLTFSTDGAVLEQIAFKAKEASVRDDIVTITSDFSQERETRAFLLALDEQTPYYYTLQSQDENDEKHTLVYIVETELGFISKTFSIFKNSYRIDLNVALKPVLGDKEEVSPLQARIFYPAPQMGDSVAKDIVSGLVSDRNNRIVTHNRSVINEHEGWFTPTLFGGDNKYFIHAVVADSDHFIKRAYFKLVGQDGLYAILEGPSVATESSWTMSYYFGPKESPAIMVVDDRLEQTMGYSGWFGSLLFPISKLLLIVLNYFYRYLGNYGFAIIAVTILVRLLLVPFTMKGMPDPKQQGAVRRKMELLKKKYKNEPDRLAQEQMELMRKEGLPGLGGCLPLLLQVPIFIGLSRALSSSIDLYKEPFVLWITDLAAPDPWYVLPGLLVVAMLVQATTVDQKQQMMMMISAMVFGAFAVNLSAGLCLYIIVSVLLAAGQTALQKRLKTT